MKPRPPHLPKQEDVPVHQAQKHSLFYFFSCAFISIAASLSTVFVALSWIVPRAVPEVRFYSFQHEAQASSTSVNQDVATRIGEREAVLYDRSTQIGSGWYAAHSALSHGVFLTSDGWAVFPADSVIQDSIKKDQLEVIDNRGVRYTVDGFHLDKTFSLVYAHVVGNGFHFVSFGNWETLKPDTTVIGKQYDQFVSQKLGVVQNISVESLELWKPTHRLTLEKVDPGIIFSEQGELLGVAGRGGLLPGWYLENSLQSILSKHALSFAAFPWKGKFVDQSFQNGFVKPLNGFFITDLGGDKNKNGMKVGDVIVKVSGMDVTALTLSKLVFQSPDPVTFDIFRDGKPLQKILPKQTLNF